MEKLRNEINRKTVLRVGRRSDIVPWGINRTIELVDKRNIRALYASDMFRHYHSISNYWYMSYRTGFLAYTAIQLLTEGNPRYEGAIDSIGMKLSTVRAVVAKGFSKKGADEAKNAAQIAWDNATFISDHSDDREAACYGDDFYNGDTNLLHEDAFNEGNDTYWGNWTYMNYWANG